MIIESDTLKESLERMKSKTDHIVDRCFNRGLETAIKLIELYEETAKLSPRL